MRYGTARVPEGSVPVVWSDSHPHLLTDMVGRTVTDLVELDEDDRASSIERATLVAGDLSLGAPVLPRKIVAIGLNYLDHIRETGMEAPTIPLVFAKFPSCVVGPADTIDVDPNVTQQVDWEVELAVVMGRRASHVDEDAALEHVFGYTVANDVSARDVQFSDGQWVRGKSLDSFCPLGPTVVTADEIGDPQSLGLSTTVNGEIVQSSSTSEMLFGVAALIAFCSRSFTLERGDVLLTGTPWGCGGFMDPPRYLRDGDLVECHVEGIGSLANRGQFLGSGKAS